MIAWFLSLSLHRKLIYIVCYAVVNALPMWLMIFQQRKALSRATSEKFKPFVRNDLASWSYSMALVTQFFALPRYLLLLLLMFCGGFFT